MDEIEIVPHQPDWLEKFRSERELILGCLSGPPLAIEHVGSTSVPGLPSKPIIDILVLVADLDATRGAIPALEATGYSFWRDNPDTARVFLAKGLPPAPHRTYYLHIVADAGKLDHHVLFRDWLRDHPDDRDAYAALKHDLAGRHRHDREAYTDGKTAWIAAIVEKARNRSA